MVGQRRWHSAAKCKVVGFCYSTCVLNRCSVKVLMYFDPYARQRTPMCQINCEDLLTHCGVLNSSSPSAAVFMELCCWAQSCRFNSWPQWTHCNGGRMQKHFVYVNFRSCVVPLCCWLFLSYAQLPDHNRQACLYFTSSISHAAV